MIGFLKNVFNRNNSEEQSSEENSLNQAKLPEEESLSGVQAILSLPPEWKEQTILQKIIEEESAQLPPIQEGQIRLNRIYAYFQDERLEIAFYVCNGLSRPIKLEKTPLRIVNQQKEVLASQIFDLSAMGEIPPQSVRPWQVFFDQDNVFVSELPNDAWQIAFDLQSSRVTNFEFEYLPTGVSDAQREQLTAFLESLAPLKPNEVNISPYQARLLEDGSLEANIVIRNASTKVVELNNLTLAIKDAKQSPVAAGNFHINNLVIKPYKALLWNLKFPAEVVKVQNADLSKWSLHTVRQGA